MLFIKITPYILLVTNGKLLLLSYREIWEIQKDAFIRRYQRLNPPVSSFDADIYRCVMLVYKSTQYWQFLSLEILCKGLREFKTN